jgi:hypothetical protein
MQRKLAADKAGLPSDPKPERSPRKRALTRQRHREREKAEREAEQDGDVNANANGAAQYHPNIAWSSPMVSTASSQQARRKARDDFSVMPPRPESDARSG